MVGCISLCFFVAGNIHVYITTYAIKITNLTNTPPDVAGRAATEQVTQLRADCAQTLQVACAKVQTNAHPHIPAIRKQTKQLPNVAMQERENAERKAAEVSEHV